MRDVLPYIALVGDIVESIMVIVLLVVVVCHTTRIDALEKNEGSKVMIGD